ncbi:MAG: hypothetical protein WCW68_09570 [Methanothrix sp.]
MQQIHALLAPLAACLHTLPPLNGSQAPTHGRAPLAAAGEGLS